MAELPDDLKAAVEDQAQARVEMNVQGYAKYLTPEAVDTLRASFQGIPPRVSQFGIADVQTAGRDYIVEVSYLLREKAFIVRSRWHREGDAWLVIHAERLWAEGEKRRSSLFGRLVMAILGPLARRRRRN
jgi:hypothetical protein